MEIAFTSKFPDGFNLGNELVIAAKPKDGGLFCISLMTGNDIIENKYDVPKCAIPFQIQFRYDHKVAIMKAFTGQAWCDEAIVTLTVNLTENLNIKLLATNVDIEVHLNDTHFAIFKHRRSLGSITHFNVYGDFIVEKVRLH